MVDRRAEAELRSLLRRSDCIVQLDILLFNGGNQATAGANRPNQMKYVDVVVKSEAVFSTLSNVLSNSEFLSLSMLLVEISPILTICAFEFKTKGRTSYTNFQLPSPIEIDATNIAINQMMVKGKILLLVRMGIDQV